MFEKIYVIICGISLQEETLNPGWARSVDGQWVAVVNTNAYPQEVKTVRCQ